MKKLILINSSIVFLTFVFIGCKKTNTGGTVSGPDTTTIKPQVDPPVAGTIGFFLDDWQPRTYTPPASFTNTTVPAAAGVVVTIDRSNVLTKIPRSFAGNNSNLWMSQIITESALMDHITTLHPHIIRFPGGSISDVFFWNAQPDTPPADAPANLVQANGSTTSAGYWYGKNSAAWTFSVDNFYTLLQQSGNQGMITINYGYARYGKSNNPVANAAHLAADWVRHDNGRTKYWEIGNENFGDWEAGYRINTADNKDGQPEYLSGQLYGQHFKVFADSMRKAAQQIGKTIYIGAVMSESAPQAWWTNTAKNWNSGLTTGAGNSPDFYIVHNYYTPYNVNSNADVILNSALTVTTEMMNHVKQTITTAGLTIKPVILGEWNIFSTGSKQQVSHINGLHAVLVLGETLKNNFGMTARWDLANAWSNGDDHGMFNNGDEPDGVPKWSPRPAFYHMYYFQKLVGDRLVAAASTNTDIICYASSYTSGETGAILVNKSAETKTVEIKIDNFKKGARFIWYTLTGGGDNGEFSRKVNINGAGSNIAAGGPANYKTISANAASTSNGIRVVVPAKSSVFMVVEKP